ncbi:arginine--tRNA ligase [Halalkalibacillus halophilus]|uniref:arginine--tRNA ligase n=1 Tax=Halalkalibacillus halophilus TaxID=392827 RepID=UPI000406CDE6|nr:arginine--tRNA ligase [Halalkalibacillus halophilus]
MSYVDVFSDIIAKQLNGELTKEEIMNVVEKPKFEGQGDLAFPCFTLAKTMKVAPHKIASDLAQKLEHPLFEKVVSEGPYVNGFLDQTEVSKEVMKTVLEQGRNFGSHEFGHDERIVIDFSSPNIAKPFSMGHLRSTVIGNAISNIAEKCGYQTVKVNHLGDWGTQFGKLIVAYKLWGNEATVREEPIKELLSLYVKFHEEVKNNSDLDELAREWFKKLEDGDEEALNLWRWFRGESLKEFSKIYELLNVAFDSYHGEAFYNDKMKDTITELKRKNLVTHSEGAEVVELSEFNMPPCLLTKSDGATLYATRDLTAAFYRYDNYKFAKSLYVVGHEQSLHFNQLFSVLKKGEYPWADRLEHVPFGFILKDGKKMSTRQGKVVLLEEVIEEAISTARNNIEEKNPELNDKDDVARMVGVGAIIFHDLKNDRKSNIEFSIEDMLRFEGSTGPYVQYTYARTQSILRKAKLEKISTETGLSDPYSWAVIKAIDTFPKTILKAFHGNDPSQIAKYLIDLCRDFNKYYANEKILIDDEGLEARLALVKSVSIVIEEGLNLLGIEAPKAM